MITNRSGAPAGWRYCQNLLFVCIVALIMVLAGNWPASAQSCTSDFQCGPSAGGYNVCLGDTLIMRRRICVGGQCLEQETGRLSCGGGSIGGTCRGNVYVTGGSRCDAAAGRCAQGGSVQIACVKSCSCFGRTLTIATGTCTPGAGCGRTVMRCKVGCTCTGEPRCTEDPQPEPPQRRSGVPAPPVESRLPPRTAEPFEAGPPRASSVRPVTAKTKQRKSRRVRRPSKSAGGDGGE